MNQNSLKIKLICVLDKTHFINEKDCEISMKKRMKI
jgi:hypothetical protein